MNERRMFGMFGDARFIFDLTELIYFLLCRKHLASILQLTMARLACAQIVIVGLGTANVATKRIRGCNKGCQ